MTRLIQTDGEKLSHTELLHNCIFTLNAGHETTTNLIGNALCLLDDYPKQRKRLVNDEALIAPAIDEFLRFESPNQVGNRLTTEEVVLHGETIPASTNLHLLIGAANRDESVFVNSETLDISRSPNKHLAFAGGPHSCLGLNLARMEGRVAIGRFLQSVGVSKETVKLVSDRQSGANTTEYAGYSSATASTMAGALSSVTSVMEAFRAGIREETSPIQLWPHHFDLSMIWLPGDQIAGEDPDDEENADKQMNFGFVFGDEGIPAPYFYITAYPTPTAFSTLELPKGTDWKSNGFTGAVLTYRSLLHQANPAEYLFQLWQQLLAAGNLYMINNIK